MKHQVHELKCWPAYFAAALSGNKPFEVRKDDREYQVGDSVLLREYTPPEHMEADEIAEYPDGYYSGRILHREISYILKGEHWGIMKGYVVLGLKKI